MIDWISVEDRLPSKEDNSLRVIEPCIVFMEYLINGNTCKNSSYDRFDSASNDWLTYNKNSGVTITHWIYAKDLPFPT